MCRYPSKQHDHNKVGGESIHHWLQVLQVMMWKKCFFFWLCLVREREDMEQCRLHFWSHVFGEIMFWSQCFVTMNCEFISWEFHETFSIITCARLNFELAVWSRESQLYDEGGGPGGPWLVLVISFVVIVVQHAPPLPLAQRHFQSMIVLGSGVPSSFAMIGNVLGRNPQL